MKFLYEKISDPHIIRMPGGSRAGFSALFTTLITGITGPLRDPGRASIFLDYQIPRDYNYT